MNLWSFFLWGLFFFHSPFFYSVFVYTGSALIVTAQSIGSPPRRCRSYETLPWKLLPTSLMARRFVKIFIGIDPNPVSYIHSSSLSGSKRIMVLTAPFLSMLQYPFEKTSLESVTAPL